MKWVNQSKHKDAWIVAAAMVVFVGCTYIASSQSTFGPLETRFFYLIYELPALLRLPMYVLTQLGSAGAFMMAVITALVCGRKKMAALLFTSGVLAFTTTSLTKWLVARPRPSEVLPDVVTYFDSVDGYGFPSGHTALATAIGITLMAFVPKQFRIWLWLMIIGVGLSRMILGVHVPLDVIGGFCIGVIAAIVARVVINRTKLAKSR